MGDVTVCVCACACACVCLCYVCMYVFIYLDHIDFQNVFFLVCSAEERCSYRLEMAWEELNNDTIFISLRQFKQMCMNKHHIGKYWENLFNLNYDVTDGLVFSPEPD